MQPSILLGAAALLAAAGILAFADAPAAGAEPAANVAPPPTGHLVLIVEGDRDRLDVTHAVRKPDPWAGVPKGLTSAWTLSIRDARGAELAAVPLDMSPFDLAPERKGQPLQVQGCVVRDPKVTMLVNAPSLPDAASYVFLRAGVVVGTAEAVDVDQLAEGGR